ncbi:hypothetical protein ACMFMG_007530 [Clarireedia jacksonii]
MESAGEFKTTLPLANDSNSPMETETLLVPAAPAQFPGSFAPDLRDAHQAVARVAGWKRIRVYFTDGWDDVQLWKSAVSLLLVPRRAIILISRPVMQFIEFVGSTCLCYLSAMITITIINSNTTQVAAYVGITNIFLLWLFISALAPASGGHINPIITFATLLAGLTGFPRAVLYLIGQIAGAALAGGLIRGSLGAERIAAFHGGGCYLDTSLMTEGQAYLVESVLSFTLLFLSFGVGLDPRQAQLFGPKLGPFMVGCSLGLTSFASIGLAPGYPGGQMNPGRCFAFAVARGVFKHQWIWWFGPVTGVAVQACVYRFAPPYRKEKAVARDA